ncbi:MAG TPA: fused MFS/spermidine synthase [Usitatibacter sp.]|nr:fused MFS/spermidine synthase [Usitatibacter sp.]
MASIHVSERDGVRFLHLGSDLVQGAMRIARPWALELEYTREMMLPLLLRPTSWPATVLQVGLGSASITRFLYRHRPKARLAVIEIEPGVVAAARQFFKLPDDPRRLRVDIGDGHDFIAAATRRFDFIVVDGFDAEGRAGMLETLPFYLNCRQRLTDRGMLSVNLIDRGRGVARQVAALREAFEGRVLALPPSNDGNCIAVASALRPLPGDPAELEPAVAALKAETGLDLAGTVERLKRHAAAPPAR